MEAVSISECREQYINFVRDHAHGNLFQSALWFAYQEATGNRPGAFLFFRDGLPVASCLYARRLLPFGLEYRYVPRGPLCEKPADVTEVLEHVGGRNTIHVLVDPGYPDAFVPAPDGSRILDKGIIPADTLVTDLSPTGDNILAAMKSKGRYNIKLAREKGVVARHEPAPMDNIDFFYSMLSATSVRKKIALPARPVIAELFNHTNAHLYFALYENEPVAAAIIVLWGKTAYFLYGASSGIHRNVMAPYLLHYTMMMDAKARGMKSYDFMGVSPDDNMDHYLSGISRFKRQFGGTIVRLAPPFLYVKRPILSRLLVIVQKPRRRVLKKGVKP